jgi:hypothetical protein
MPAGFSKRWTPIDALGIFCEDRNFAAAATSIIEIDQAAPTTDPVIIDLVGGRQDIIAVVDITALDVVSNDELYTFRFQGSNDPTFAALSFVNLATLILGAAEVSPGNAMDGVKGRYALWLTNQLYIQNAAAAQYRYVRLQLVVAGTTPSITFSAWLSRPASMLA